MWAMENIYIRKGLEAPGIGLVPFNDYYLGNVKRINSHLILEEA